MKYNMIFKMYFCLRSPSSEKETVIEHEEHSGIEMEHGYENDDPLSIGDGYLNGKADSFSLWNRACPKNIIYFKQNVCTFCVCE